MQAFVVPPNVPRDHATVRSVIGGDWLDRRVDAAVRAMKQKNTFSPSAIGMSLGRLTHPLVAELFALKRGHDDQTPYLDLLELDLGKLQRNLPTDLQPRIRSDDAAPKVVHELRVAAGLARLGHQISWLPDEGKKRPEMVVDPDSADAVSVECKKRDRRDGYEKNAGRFWEHFQYAMRLRMEEDGLNYWAKVVAEDFRLGDVDLIVKQAIELLRSNESGSTPLGEGRYELEFLRLADRGGSIPSDVFALIPRGVYGINHGEVDSGDLRVPRFEGDSFSEGLVTNPRAIRLELPDDPTRRIRGVLRNLKTAAQQLLLGMPGLVYIDLSFGSWEPEASDFESIANAVAAELGRGHRRVSAVILLAIEPTRLADGFPGWWIRTELIRHPNPLYPLSAKLPIPGDESSKWVPGQWMRPARAATGAGDLAPLFPWDEPGTQ